MATHGTRAATSAMCLATLIFGATEIALAASEPPPVGGCYRGTFSGWHRGTVDGFTFGPITGTISDPSIHFTFRGIGHETGGLSNYKAEWFGDPGSATQPGGYQMVNKYFYGSGTFRSESLNDPVPVLLSGRASSNGNKINLRFVTQSLEAIKFRLKRNTGATLVIDPPNPTVEPNGTITLTATVTGVESQVVQWTIIGNQNSYGGFFDEEQPPNDNTVVFHAGRDEPRYITFQATSVENGCAIGSTLLTVQSPP